MVLSVFSISQNIIPIKYYQSNVNINQDQVEESSLTPKESVEEITRAAHLEGYQEKVKF